MHIIMTVFDQPGCGEFDRMVRVSGVRARVLSAPLPGKHGRRAAVSECCAAVSPQNSSKQFFDALRGQRLVSA